MTLSSGQAVTVRKGIDFLAGKLGDRFSSQDLVTDMGWVESAPENSQFVHLPRSEILMLIAS